MTLDEGKQLALDGVDFGVVYPLLYSDEDRRLFKGWWLTERSVPTKVGGSKVRPPGPSPSVNGRSENKSRNPTGGTPRKPEAEATGNLCPKSGCGGLMVRTGTCLTCQSCGETSGGCS